VSASTERTRVMSENPLKEKRISKTSECCSAKGRRICVCNRFLRWWQWKPSRTALENGHPLTRVLTRQTCWTDFT